MGLKKNIKFKGIDINNAYIKIKHFNGNKDIVCFNIQVYVNKETSDNDDSNYLYVSKMFKFKPDLESNENIWRQAYKILKQQEEFKDAEDV